MSVPFMNVLTGALAIQFEGIGLVCHLASEATNQHILRSIGAGLPFVRTEYTGQFFFEA